MKSIIKKLVLVAFVLLNLAITTQVTFADQGTTELNGATGTAGGGSAKDLGKYHDILKPAQDAPCIKEDGDDGNYIITVIEEPLDVKDNEQAADFRYRKCYRHSFTVVDDRGVSENYSELSKISCLQTATDEAKKINEGDFPSFKSANYFCKEVQVILSKGGTAMIYGYIGMLYKWGASMAGIIAVTIIILSGIQISAAGGDPEAVGSAKKRILKSIAGIAVLFLSGLILYTVNPNFFVTS